MEAEGVADAIWEGKTVGRTVGRKERTVGKNAVVIYPACIPYKSEKGDWAHQFFPKKVDASMRLSVLNFHASAFNQRRANSSLMHDNMK